MNLRFCSFLFFFYFSSQLFAAKDPLLSEYEHELKDKLAYQTLQDKTLKLGGKAIPTLIEVMKEKKYADKNRWLACFMLARIMGKKSADYLSKLAYHEDWVLRLAALKSLLNLSEKRFGDLYAKKLQDSSMIVRLQALENIRALGLSEKSPEVLQMLFDKQNYQTVHGKLKRSNLIKRAVVVLGELKFQKAYPMFLGMIQKDRYRDLFSELNTSLVSLSGKKPPESAKDYESVKKFWLR